MTVIVSSVIVSDDPQHDGRRRIHEIHTDYLGIEHERNYLVESDYDAQAAMVAYAAQIESDLINAEIQQNTQNVLLYGALATYTFNYSTKDQNASVLKEAYTTGIYKGVDLINIGAFVASLTDDQLIILFAMDQASVNTLRAGRLATELSLAGEIKNYGVV